MYFSFVIVTFPMAEIEKATAAREVGFSNKRSNLTPR